MRPGSNPVCMEQPPPFSAVLRNALLWLCVKVTSWWLRDGMIRNTNVFSFPLKRNGIDIIYWWICKESASCSHTLVLSLLKGHCLLRTITSRRSIIIQIRLAVPCEVKYSIRPLYPLPQGRQERPVWWGWLLYMFIYVFKVTQSHYLPTEHHCKSGNVYLQLTFFQLQGGNTVLCVNANAGTKANVCNVYLPC